MFTKLSLKNRLLLSFAIPPLLFIGFSTLVFLNSNQTDKTLKQVKTSQALIVETDEMALRIALMGRQVRGYLLVGNAENALGTYEIEKNKFHEVANRAESLIKDLEKKQQQERITRIIQLEAQYEELSSNIFRLKDQGKQKEAIDTSLRESRKIIGELDKLSHEFREEELAVLTRQLKTTEDSIGFIRVASVVIPIIASAIAVVVGYLIATLMNNLNALIRQVRQSGVQFTASTNQIAVSGNQLDATMNEQIASINEVTSTAKQIATTSQKLAKTMDEVQYISQITAQAADESQQNLIKMETSMGELIDATSTISAKLEDISEKTNKINSIIFTITKVADQTNLLSLNAAIEADKAGKYGTGFAVVAKEIRRLADQTGVATLDIETMITQMQAAVSTGVMEIEKFTQQVKHSVEDVHIISASLESIIGKVQTLTPRFQQVGGSMNVQSQGAVQISDAMVHLSEAASQTAESLHDINGAIAHLNEAAQSLRQEMSHFNVGRD